jgi:hypothetical protein
VLGGSPEPGGDRRLRDPDDEVRGKRYNARDKDGLYTAQGGEIDKNGRMTMHRKLPSGMSKSDHTLVNGFDDHA